MEEYKPRPRGARVIGEQIEKGVTSIEEIAKNTGYKPTTVRAYLSYYFPTHRIRTCKSGKTHISETTKKIIELLKSGMCQAQIAREMGVSRQRVYEVKKTHIGMPCNTETINRKALATDIFRRVLTLYQGLSKAERETMAFEWKLLDLAVEYGVEVVQ